jgi:hypothetical protein
LLPRSWQVSPWLPAGYKDTPKIHKSYLGLIESLGELSDSVGILWVEFKEKTYETESVPGAGLRVIGRNLVGKAIGQPEGDGGFYAEKRLYA